MNFKRVKTKYGTGVESVGVIVVYSYGKYIIIRDNIEYFVFKRDVSHLEIVFTNAEECFMDSIIREVFIVFILTEQGIAEYKLTSDTVASLSYPNGINTSLVSINVVKETMALALNVPFLLSPPNLITFDNVADDRSDFKSLFNVCGILLADDSKLLVRIRDDGNPLFVKPQTLHHENEKIMGYLVHRSYKYQVFTIAARYEDVVNITNGDKSYRIPKEWIK